MSLSSFLLGENAAGGKRKEKGKNIDKSLNDIFASSATTPSTSKVPVAAASSATNDPKPPRPSKEKKRKLTDEAISPSSPKRSKTSRPDAPTQFDKPVKKHKVKEASKKNAEPSADEPEEPDHEPLSPPSSTSKSPKEEHHARGSGEESSEEEGDPSRLVHESLIKGGIRLDKPRKSSAKHVPADESTDQRNARTIFVGNVSVEVTKSRPLLKQLKKHILFHVPTAKIESVRLRSVGFQKPTAPPTDADSKGKAKAEESEGRQHDRDRAASWRARQSGLDEADEAASAPAKKFLTPAEKKRIAFIKNEIHTGVDSVNAYVVFAHPTPDAGTRPANLPPPAPVMDPYEAAKLATENCDGTTFLERTIRVDLVGKGVVDEHAGKSAEVGGDPKLTVFVGNLDFASKEEDLRVFFEGLISAERGPPPESDDHTDDEEDEDGTKTEVKPRMWVRRVRIIRDKDTLLGKGFAYVQFVDRECVDEVLSLEEARLKFAKRKLRVQRCKTLPGGKIKSSAAIKPTVPSKARVPSSSRPAPSGPIPKGDPNLGPKISHLSKDERKNVKKSDADRVARRLAKKAAKGKMALVEKGVKAKLSDRERTRKWSKDHRQKTTGDKAKRRVRSDKAISKLNTKK